MFTESKERLAQLGAEITTREIKQQPELWQETYQNYLEKQEDITAFLDEVYKNHAVVKVIFTGAGSSDFVGESIFSYLNSVNDTTKINFQAVGTVELVARPKDYLKKDVPTILVSFARSGNSPESLAALNLAKQFVKDLYLIHITCAEDGQLALSAKDTPNTLLLLQPSRSNDAGFAMTGSFSCMMLTALLVFSTADNTVKASWVQAITRLGQDVLARETDIQDLIDLGAKRVIYLGAGGLRGLAHETQLKVLELTAGEIATMYETPLGFRHGPKSFIDDETLLILFTSNDSYTKQYDIDLLNEVYHDKIAKKVIALTYGDIPTEAPLFVLDKAGAILPDALAAFPYLIFGQIFSLLAAIKCGNRPDTPSPTGTVNRVVQGVIIHDWQD